METGMTTEAIELLMRESFKKRNLVISTSPEREALFIEAISINHKKRPRIKINGGKK